MPFNEIHPIFLVECVAAAILVLHYLVVFLPILWGVSSKKLQGGEEVDISVVICQKNEKENLRKNLPKILNQSKRNYDVVVVNDQSWDDSQEILEEIAERNPNLHLVEVRENERHRTGKKLALTLGIKGANSDQIILTDADCQPASQYWVNVMAHYFSKGYDMLIGYSPVKGGRSITAFFQQCDSLLTAIQYLGWGKLGLVYMGVGRNLAYSRKKFFEVGGFKKDYHIMAGDDDLFVNRYASKFRKKVVLHQDSFVETEPQKNFLEWIRQKKRHYSVSKHYKFFHKLLLMLFPFSNMVLLGGVLSSCLLFPEWFLWGVYLLIGKLILSFIVGVLVGNNLKQPLAGFFLFLMEYFFLFFYPLVYFFQTVSPIKRWH